MDGSHSLIQALSFLSGIFPETYSPLLQAYAQSLKPRRPESRKCCCAHLSCNPAFVRHARLSANVWKRLKNRDWKDSRGRSVFHLYSRSSTPPKKAQRKRKTKRKRPRSGLQPVLQSSSDRFPTHLRLPALSFPIPNLLALNQHGHRSITCDREPCQFPSHRSQADMHPMVSSEKTAGHATTYAIPPHPPPPARLSEKNMLHTCQIPATDRQWDDERLRARKETTGVLYASRCIALHHRSPPAYVMHVQADRPLAAAVIVSCMTPMKPAPLPPHARLKVVFWGLTRQPPPSPRRRKAHPIGSSGPEQRSTCRFDFPLIPLILSPCEWAKLRNKG